MERCNSCFNQLLYCSCDHVRRALDEVPPEMTERLAEYESRFRDLDEEIFAKEAKREMDTLARVEAKHQELLREFTEHMGELNIDESCRINSREVYWCGGCRLMHVRYFCAEHRCYHVTEPAP